MKITKKDNIPSMGDMVDDVKYNKARTMGCIIFDNGSKVFFNCDPTEFSKMRGTSVSEQSKKVVPVKKEHVESRVDIMASTSPDNQDYHNKALETISRIDDRIGYTKADKEEMGQESQPVGDPTAKLESDYSKVVPPPTEDFKSAAQSAIDRSERKSSSMVTANETKQKMMGTGGLAIG